LILPLADPIDLIQKHEAEDANGLSMFRATLVAVSVTNPMFNVTCYPDFLEIMVLRQNLWAAWHPHSDALQFILESERSLQELHYLTIKNVPVQFVLKVCH
jgi:hypothetical protein